MSTMNRVMPKHSISLWIYILVSFLYLTTCFSKLHVHITSHLPKNSSFLISSLLLHCRSADDDLGYHSLNFNEFYTWAFRMNFWETTLYYCDYWWANKHAAFHAFDSNIWNLVPPNETGVDHYYYHVETDGFYFWLWSLKTNTSSWKRVHEWDDIWSIK